MDRVVLDSSALLALINNELGADKVESLLGSVVMSSVNVSEVVSKLLDLGISPQEAQAYLRPLILEVVPFEEEDAFQTASLKAQTKKQGLSLGDRACIALGAQMQLPVYTADRVWKDLALDSVDIRLIRD